MLFRFQKSINEEIMYSLNCDSCINYSIPVPLSFLFVNKIILILLKSIPKKKQIYNIMYSRGLKYNV